MRKWSGATTGASGAATTGAPDDGRTPPAPTPPPASGSPGAGSSAARSEPAPSIGPGPLLRYRVFAFTTATLLIVLVFVGVPLQLAAGRPEVVNVVGTAHGFLYIGYLVVAFDLTRRLAVPKWQMLLVLLAGTVPFCAFVAERKMTRRFDVATGTGHAGTAPDARRPAAERVAFLQRRWLSRRALLLHLEVLVIAPACAAAGWWQATRALSGNQLSWVYSVEWPVFSLLAVAGWWHLVHEDPAAYRARRARRPPDADRLGHLPTPGDVASGPSAGGVPGVAIEPAIARFASLLAGAVGIEVVLGVMGAVAIPFGRPSGWLPSEGSAVYVVHALAGGALLAGAVTLVVRARRAGRTARLVAWMGLVCVGMAATGGLLADAASLWRLLGIALMFVGSVLAGLDYLVPTFVRLQHRSTAAAPGANAGGPTAAG